MLPPYEDTDVEDRWEFELDTEIAQLDGVDLTKPMPLDLVTRGTTDFVVRYNGLPVIQILHATECIVVQPALEKFNRAFKRANDTRPEKILRGLAAQDPYLVRKDGIIWCRFCFSDQLESSAGSEVHASSCSWAQAKYWVSDQNA